MASKNTVLTVTSLNSGDLSFDSDNGAKNNIRHFIDHLEGGLNGSHTIRTATIRDSAVAGSATITLASMAAGTVLLINGVPFTAKGSAATSGNNEFDISGGTDTLDATALAAAINASTSTGISGVLTATSASAVVTITAAQPGLGSNGITIENLGVVATGTATCSSVDAADNISINGQAITAHATTAANNQFVVGATDAATATNLAAAINGSTTAIVSKHVRALARAAVVHIFAKYGGIAGNAITLATSDGTDLAVSGTGRLTGGTAAQHEGAQATQTVTISGADGGNYTVLVNGVTTGNVAGTNGNDTATAASIVAAINGLTDALVRGHVTAANSSGVITLTAVRGGHLGNAITVSATGTGATAGGTRLTGGALPTVSVVAGGTQTPVGGGANLTGGSNSTAISLTL
jgi:hypothetical protein